MESFWSRLSWPQVAALALVVAGAVLVLVFVPATTLSSAPWEAWVGGIVTILGVLLGASSAPLVRPSRPPPPRSRRDGSAPIEVAAWIAVWALAALVALHSAGCGGGLLAQARAATVATVAVDGGRRAMLGEAERRAEACADEPCVISARESMRPAEAAYEGIRLTLAAWIAGLDVAHLAGDGDGVASALTTVALRFAADWAAFAAAMAGVGLELPALPIGGAQ